MKLFNEATGLLQRAEEVMLDTGSPRRGFWRQLIRFAVHPFTFLAAGIGLKMRTASIASFCVTALVVVGAWCFKASTPASPLVASIVFWGSLAAGSLMAVFAVPSTYAAGGIGADEVDALREYLRGRRFPDASNVDLLKKSIKPFEDRARSRIVTLKWLVGSCWAVALYLASRIGDHPPVGSGALSDAVWSAAGAFLAAVLGYLMVWGYEAAIDKLFRLVEFACNEDSLRLQLTAGPAEPTPVLAAGTTR